MSVPVGPPSQLTDQGSDLLDRVTRTETTNELTQQESPNDESCGSATPTGGLDDSSDLDWDDPTDGHTGMHVYVVIWPDWGIVKVGLSMNQRWVAFHGARLIAQMGSECDDCARAMEKHLIGHLRRRGIPAFRSSQDALPLLGSGGAGWTECTLLPRSAPKPSRDPWDYESAYGVQFPVQFLETLNEHFACYPSAGVVSQ